MHRWSRAVALAVLLGSGWTACQRGETSQSSAREETGQAAPEPPSPRLDSYAQDVDDICHSEQRSGALERDKGERILIVAQWLGKTLRTDEGRSFVANLSQASAAEKVAILDGEALRLGLAGCPLARTWEAKLEN